TMVVPVLIISCQVFENWNAGPVTAQIIMMRIAMVKAHALPRTADELRANMRNASWTMQKKSRSGFLAFRFSGAALFIILTLVRARVAICAHRGCWLFRAGSVGRD